MNKIVDICDEVDFPPGVLNLVNGTHDVTDALLTHPDMKGVSFVGSTPAGLHVYKTATAAGKRAQCQGGAKNMMVVMPDADVPGTMGAIMTSSYGCAGQRCLAGSVILAVGDVYEEVKKRDRGAASKIRVGYGLDEGVQMGPVISAKAKATILEYIEIGLKEGAKLFWTGAESRCPATRTAISSARPSSTMSTPRCASSTRRSSARSLAIMQRGGPGRSDARDRRQPVRQCGFDLHPERRRGP